MVVIGANAAGGTICIWFAVGRLTVLLEVLGLE